MESQYMDGVRGCGRWRHMDRVYRDEEVDPVTSRAHVLATKALENLFRTSTALRQVCGTILELTAQKMTVSTSQERLVASRGIEVFNSNDTVEKMQEEMSALTENVVWLSDG
jgi:hypothetical protein